MFVIDANGYKLVKQVLETHTFDYQLMIVIEYTLFLTNL